MQLGDIIIRETDTATPDAPLTEVARRMIDGNIRVLPVCSEGRLVGAVTRRDLFMRATAAGGDPRAKRVRDVMDYQVTVDYEDDSLPAALARLQQTGQTRLFVLTRTGQLAGWVDAQTLIQHCVRGGGPS